MDKHLLSGAAEPRHEQTKTDCGCGCGGGGKCGERGTRAVTGRRRLLVGGVGVTAFAATLASRPANATCNTLTSLYSPTNSHAPTGTCTGGGKTPGFWATHLACWPQTILPSDRFSR